MEQLLERVGIAPSAWTTGVAVMAVAVTVGWIVGTVVHRGLAMAARTSAATWDDELVPRLRRPIKIVAAVVAGWIALPALPLTSAAARVASAILNVGTTAVVIWLAFRFIDVGVGTLLARGWAADRPSARSLLALGGRIAKLAIVVIALITALAAMGVPVASLVAGLGIGGLAVALAAQKTLANLFGALSIGADRPFREGDQVKVGDVEGKVEAIGLRSTRIRTAARTVVTIPNAELADTRTESFAACDRFLVAAVLNLVYGTRAEQVRELLTSLEADLRALPKVWPESVNVRFTALTAVGLEVRVQVWLVSDDPDEYPVLRQDVLFAILAAIDRAGATLAYPTQTVHVAER